jgi:hypothetical protein
VNESIDVSYVEKRVQRHFLEDGLWEIFTGVVLITLGAFVYSQDEFLYMILLLGTLFNNSIMQFFRKRFIYPRTGYVKPVPPSERRRRLWKTKLIAVFIIVVLFSGFAVLFWKYGTAWMTPIVPWLPLVFGVILATGSLYLARRSGLPRLYFIALLCVLIGIGASFLVLSSTLSGGMGIFMGFLATGLVVIVSGSITLSIFIRNHPLLEEEELNGEE